MFCKNCGNEIKDGVKFCSKCGTEQVIHTDFPEKSDNETIENNTDIKNNSSKSNKGFTACFVCSETCCMCL